MSQHPDIDQGTYVVLLRHITAVPTSYNSWLTSLTLSACNMQKFVWLYGHNAPPYWVKHSDISKDSQAQSTTNVSIMQSCASLRHNNGVPVAISGTLLHVH